MAIKRAVISIVLICIATIYLIFSDLKHIVITEEGEISGLSHKLREKARGDAFWNNQLSLVNARIDWEENFPNRMVKINEMIIKMNDDADKTLQQFYTEYPTSRPSHSQELAESLRKQADEIEQAEMNVIMEEYRLKRIKELKNIRVEILNVLSDDNTK